MKIKSIATIIIAGLVAATAFAAAANEVSGTIKAGEYAVNAHVRSIPAEHRAMAKATHHLSVTVADATGAQINNVKVVYEFMRGKTVAAKGDLMFMGGSMPDHGGMHHDTGGVRGPTAMGDHGHNSDPAQPAGHFGADLTLPGPGKYKLVIKVHKGSNMSQGSVDLQVP